MPRRKRRHRPWPFTKDSPTPTNHTTTRSSSTNTRAIWRWRWETKRKRSPCSRRSISCSRPVRRKRSDNPARLCYQGRYGNGRGHTLMNLELFIVIALVCCIPLWAMGVYNHWVMLRNLVDSAWAQTEVQLQRRYDLIPNLVETVKGYATHEQATFEKVIQARNTAMNAPTPEAKAGAENALSSSLKSIFAVAEAYPELKA